MRYEYDGHDAQLVDHHLRSMAEYYGTKPPSDAVMRRWLYQLAEEVPPHCAITALCDWTKRHDKWPTIAGVLVDARKIADHDAERRAQDVRSDPAVPRVSEAKPTDPALAAAVAQVLERIKAAGRGLPRRYWELEGIAAIAQGRPLGEAKRRYLEATYGDRLQDKDFLAHACEQVGAVEARFSGIPQPSQIAR